MIHIETTQNLRPSAPCPAETLQIEDAANAELFSAIQFTYDGDQQQGVFYLPDQPGRFLLTRALAATPTRARAERRRAVANRARWSVNVYVDYYVKAAMGATTSG